MRKANARHVSTNRCRSVAPPQYHATRLIYHVLNCGAGRQALFHEAEDHAALGPPAFESCPVLFCGHGAYGGYFPTAGPDAALDNGFQE
jgi:hypothetical protein